MLWTSHFVARTAPAELVQTIATHIDDALGGKAPHLLFAFVSPTLHDSLPGILRGLQARFGEELAIIGCTARGVAADGREHEEADGMAWMAAHLPDVRVVPFFATPSEARNRTAADWQAALDLIPEQQPAFVLLPEPFSTHGQELVDHLDDAFPGCPKVGGLASGGLAPGTHRVVCGQRIERSGAVGVALWGDLRMTPVVAQGARAVGPVLEVTAASGPAIRELNGRPVLEMLETLFSTLSQEDRRQFQQGPAIGLAPSGYVDGLLQTHHFLVRDMLGFKRSENALMVGAHVRAGDRMQLRVRDAASADRELRDLVERVARAPGQAVPSAAVMFACVGRGQRFFGVPDHDVSVLRGLLGAPPLAGFFCGGELGPVRGRTWVHGYTSSFGLFFPRGWS